MPECWIVGIIFPIHKKGDKLQRNVTITESTPEQCIATLVLTHIINTRIKLFTSREIGEDQYGFREARGTTN